ncbi:MAG: hypothetical protein OES57_07260, partial [Acidimicrobiia bacterium]|nr:hypothetical protein [Acidimicrobiia bacterium]
VHPPIVAAVEGLSKPRAGARAGVAMGPAPADSLTNVVLAHEGGWDEALFVAVPVVVFFLLLVLANRRANQLRDERDDDGS